MEPAYSPGSLIRLFGDGTDIRHLWNCDEPPEYDKPQLLGSAAGIQHHWNDAATSRNEEKRCTETAGTTWWRKELHQALLPEGRPDEGVPERWFQPDGKSVYQASRLREADTPSVDKRPDQAAL